MVFLGGLNLFSSCMRVLAGMRPMRMSAGLISWLSSSLYRPAA